MKLENALSIPVPVAEAWRVLLDIERIAPCVPGATLTARDGDAYSGKIKVKLGPIGLTYSGTVTFVSQDEEARVAVLEAAGRELRGNGTAKAVVTCRLVAAGEATDVLVETDLAITGRPAQFGRGALTEVAGALIDRFADNLAAELSAGPASGPDEEERARTPDASEKSETSGNGAAPSNTVPSNTAPSNTVAPRAPAAPVDLLGAAGGGALKHAGPVAAGTALLLGLLVARRVLGRRASRSAS
ncbi:SRPBCC family protein [Actinomadura sp. WMMB 499]|uniref:SRPBCC family protein n=1 Tax=Actinomadura sp. WMMB 499 TaxID=1219491 RepID=UPI001245C6FD|nr:SRPBCC family protein [Actinomadura sp. WMMB 499]QFG26168.1 carbon monoxide dehydrogenase [Actinomadura sp. WMMB 499]